MNVGSGGGIGNLNVGSVYDGAEGGNTTLTYSRNTNLNRTARGGGRGGACAVTSNRTLNGGGGAANDTSSALTLLTDNSMNIGGNSVSNFGGGGGGAMEKGYNGVFNTSSGNGGNGKSSSLPGINPAWFFGGGGGGGAMKGAIYTPGNGGKGGGGGGIHYINNSSVRFGTGGDISSTISTYYQSNINTDISFNSPRGVMGRTANIIKSGSGVPYSGGGAGANPFNTAIDIGTAEHAPGGSGLVLISIRSNIINSAT